MPARPRPFRAPSTLVRPATARLAILAAIALASVAGCADREVHVRARPVTVSEEVVGSGREAGPGDVVTIAFRVRLPDGRTVLRDERHAFELGAGTVIAAIDEAVVGMRIGGRRSLDVPPEKHWGSAGYGDGAIPPNTPLRIDVHLLDAR